MAEPPKITVPSRTKRNGKKIQDGFIKFNDFAQISEKEAISLRGFLKDVNEIAPDVYKAMRKIKRAAASQLHLDAADAEIMLSPVIEFNRGPFKIRMHSDGMMFLEREIGKYGKRIEGPKGPHETIEDLGEIYLDYIERCGRKIQAEFENKLTPEEAEKRRREWEMREKYK